MNHPLAISRQDPEAGVSVIIPTYNRAHTLPRALHSVLNQAGAACEVIVIDDASTDATSQVLQEFRDPRLLCLRHPTRLGAAAARNTGIRASHGAWIAFLDSDDEWLPGLLQAQMECFQGCRPRVGVVYTSYERCFAGYSRRLPGRTRILLSLLSAGRYHLSGNLHAALQRGNFITLQTSMIKRLCFEQVGMFDESLPRLQDWEFWLRLAPHFDFAWINQPLVRVHVTEGSISNAAAALPDAVRIILDKHGEGAPELVTHCRFILGDFHLQQGQTRQGCAYLWQAARGSPTTLIYWLASLAASLHPGFYKKLSTWIGFGYTPD